MCFIAEITSSSNWVDLERPFLGQYYRFKVRAISLREYEVVWPNVQVLRKLLDHFLVGLAFFGGLGNIDGEIGSVVLLHTRDFGIGNNLNGQNLHESIVQEDWL